MGDLIGAINEHLTLQESEDTILFAVKSSGAYVARIALAYEIDGQKFTQDISNITAGSTKTLRIPNTAKKINLKAEACVFFGIWNTIVDCMVQPFEDEINLKIGGTTLNTSWKIEKGSLK